MRDKFFMLLVLGSCAAIGMVLSLLLLSSAKGNATSFPLAHSNDTVTGTILSATTNATGAGFYAEMPLHHTFFIVAPTNVATVILDRSLNNTNWVPFSTNSLTTEAATVTEILATGKWSYFRARVSGMTNSGTITVNYLGGR